MSDSPGTVGITAWSAPNPFGERAAFALVHPVGDNDDGSLARAADRFGLKRLDASGDILPVGTEILYASLRAMQLELCTADGVWLSRPVTDAWTGDAIGRRYVVVAIGLTPLDEDADASAISHYLSDSSQIFAGLVRIRLRMERS